MKLREVLIHFLSLAIIGTTVSCNSATSRSEKPQPIAVTEPIKPAPTPAPPAPPEDSVLSAKWNNGAELLGVELGAEGRLISVQFRMDPREARLIQQGNVYVKDEATNMMYRQVFVAPKLGPVISHPRQLGQIGYAMLVNAPAPIKAGAVVTVVLGKYKQEHVFVR